MSKQLKNEYHPDVVTSPGETLQDMLAALVPCQATTSVSCLSFCPPAALRLRLHSVVMRPQLRLAGRQNYFAILRHFLLDRTLGMTGAKLAARMGKPSRIVDDILSYHAPVTPAIAMELEKAVGVSACFWNNRERRYPERLAGMVEKEGDGSKYG